MSEQNSIILISDNESDVPTSPTSPYRARRQRRVIREQTPYARYEINYNVDIEREQTIRQLRSDSITTSARLTTLVEGYERMCKFLFDFFYFIINFI